MYSTPPSTRSRGSTSAATTCSGRQAARPWACASRSRKACVSEGRASWKCAAGRRSSFVAWTRRAYGSQPQELPRRRSRPSSTSPRPRRSRPAATPWARWPYCGGISRPALRGLARGRVRSHHESIVRFLLGAGSPAAAQLGDLCLREHRSACRRFALKRAPPKGPRDWAYSQLRDSEGPPTSAHGDWASTRSPSPRRNHPPPTL